VAFKNKTVKGTWVEALEMGGLGGPKRTIYSMLGQAVTFDIIADLTGCPVVPTRSSGSLKGVDCNIPHRWVREC
jgi:hypothetical protein